jgi:hypothetical protein
VGPPSDAPSGAAGVFPQRRFAVPSIRMRLSALFPSRMQSIKCTRFIMIPAKHLIKLHALLSKIYHEIPDSSNLSSAADQREYLWLAKFLKDTQRRKERAEKLEK